MDIECHELTYDYVFLHSARQKPELRSGENNNTIHFVWQLFRPIKVLYLPTGSEVCTVHWSYSLVHQCAHLNLQSCKGQANTSLCPPCPTSLNEALNIVIFHPQKNRSLLQKLDLYLSLYLCTIFFSPLGLGREWGGDRTDAHRVLIWYLCFLPGKLDFPTYTNIWVLLFCTIHMSHIHLHTHTHTHTHSKR